MSAVERTAPEQWSKFEEAGRALEAHDWIFAKTMPQNPHWYTLRRQWQDDPLFDRTVMTLRALGYRATFGRRPYIQLDVNEHFYWTMGSPLPATILINRKPLSANPSPNPAVHGGSGYDAIAPLYDRIWTDAAGRNEDRALMELVGDLSGLSVLDVGCGTGMLLTYQQPRLWTGVDPSQGMLDVLLSKYPGRRGDVVCTPLYSFVPAAPACYDRVLALYGTASYLNDDELARIPTLLTPGGTATLMFYADGYQPETYRRTGVHRELCNAPDRVPGERERRIWHNYMLVAVGP